MSIADLLAQPPPNKPWANLYVNSINTSGTTGTGSILSAPITLQCNSGPGVDNFIVNQSNSAANNSNIALSAYNQSGSAAVKLVTVNDPSPSGAIWADGSFNIISFQPTAKLTLVPNSVSALSASYDSPGQSHVTIQNLQLPTGGGTATNLNYYEELTTTLVFSGPWASSYTRNIYFTRIGRIVTMKIDGIIQAGTISSVITTSGSIPSRFQPATSTDSTSFVSNASLFDNNRITNGILIINSNGTLQLQYSSVAGTAVDYGLSSGNGNSSGFNNLAITYSV